MYNLVEELCFIPKNPQNTASDFDIDLNDEIIKGLTVIHNGNVVWSDSPNRPAPPQKKEEQKPAEKKEQHVELKVTDDENQGQGRSDNEEEGESVVSQSALSSVLLIIFFVIVGFALSSEEALLNRVFIFILAIFIGYMVIFNVTAALHTPLMSVTNAISGIIVVGSMLELKSDELFNA
mmetsp:Transcript_36921/g.33184  ORF Transcript_36921/g.33184 Transcript_36921/m.33184 type:complete len:179 (+) Transcript_36921:622-1158(+)